MDKKMPFWIWLLQTILVFTLQLIGNYVIEVRNIGIAAGIMFICAYLADIYNKNL